jgi:hypothetical protein
MGKLSFYRWGCCYITRSETIVSLGLNIWGIDRANGEYCVVHLFPPRIFTGKTAAHDGKGS